MTRFGYVMTTYFAALAFGALAAFPPAPRLIWNASGSVPIGLYALHPAGVLHVPELVVVQPPKALATYLDQRHYLAAGVPMLKHILALPGQTVCRTDRTITVDGTAVGAALERDSRGRALPVWQGCRVLAIGQVFVMNRESADSLDGRYFGPLPITSITGCAAPLWTRGDD